MKTQINQVGIYAFVLLCMGCHPLPQLHHVPQLGMWFKIVPGYGNSTMYFSSDSVVGDGYVVYPNTSEMFDIQGYVIPPNSIFVEHELGIKDIHSSDLRISEYKKYELDAKGQPFEGGPDMTDVPLPITEHLTDSVFLRVPSYFFRADQSDLYVYNLHGRLIYFSQPNDLTGPLNNDGKETGVDSVSSISYIPDLKLYVKTVSGEQDRIYFSRNTDFGDNYIEYINHNWGISIYIDEEDNFFIPSEYDSIYAYRNANPAEIIDLHSGDMHLYLLLKKGVIQNCVRM